MLELTWMRRQADTEMEYGEARAKSHSRHPLGYCICNSFYIAHSLSVCAQALCP